VGAGLVVLGVLIGAFWAWPTYRVWSQKMTGKAELARADQNRQIAIREAEAAKESEILRAEGVAEANKIISDSLKNKSEYLTYLWIQGLQDGGNEVIYVPTEGNIPILEAGRIGVSK
jgi:regulator of protease activity HflC (stomatin/prohibitin superfamily)